MIYVHNVRNCTYMFFVRGVRWEKTRSLVTVWRDEPKQVVVFSKTWSEAKLKRGQSMESMESMAWKNMKSDTHYITWLYTHYIHFTHYTYYTLYVSLCNVTFSDKSTPDQWSMWIFGVYSTIWELSSFTTSQFKSIESIHITSIQSRIHGVKLCQVTGFFTNALLPALARCGRSFDPKLQHATATDLDAFYRWRRYEPMFPPCPLGFLGDTVKFLNAEQFCSNLGLGRPVWCICIMMYIVNSHALSFLLIQNSERCCTSFIVSFIR